MFAEMTPQEQQRVAQAYMSQNSMRATPANMSGLINQLLSNPDLAAAAMNAFGANDATNRNSGGLNAGSRIDDAIANVMANDGTVEAPMPSSRPANVKVASNNPNNVMPPSKPVELTGDDRVAKAGGPGGNVNGSQTKTTPNQSDPNSSYASDIMSVLAGLGGGGAAAYGLYKMMQGGNKQLPPEAMPDGGRAMVASEMEQPKVIPPEANVPATRSNSAPSQFDKTFAGDIEDAEYREVPPRKQIAKDKDNDAKSEPDGDADDKTRQVDERKKLTGPKDSDDRDNVKKADGKTINAEDASDEAGVSRTLNKGKEVTTAKEKIKPKVRVK